MNAPDYCWRSQERPRDALALRRKGNARLCDKCGLIDNNGGGEPRLRHPTLRVGKQRGKDPFDRLEYDSVTNYGRQRQLRESRSPRLVRKRRFRAEKLDRPEYLHGRAKELENATLVISAVNRAPRRKVDRGIPRPELNGDHHWRTKVRRNLFPLPRSRTQQREQRSPYRLVDLPRPDDGRRPQLRVSRPEVRAHKARH